MVRLCIILILISGTCSFAYTQKVEGVLRNSIDNKPVSGATVAWIGSRLSATSNENGEYKISFSKPDTLLVTRVGFKSKKIYIESAESNTNREILLSPTDNEIETVVINTGYYSYSKEKATGSFSHIDSALLNRDKSFNILQRLENAVPGLQFVNPNGKRATDIRIRGLSTINSDASPLIVLDNFPYEGDIRNIDVNDIESITVLKDAAASSIWGAKAGNGVIVMTSKRPAKMEQPRISFVVNRQLVDKPDFFYNRAWLDSETIMGIEKYRYEQGHYSFSKETPVPLYAELLQSLKMENISVEEFKKIEDTYKNTDVREQASKYLYRKADNQQYSLNVSGGSIFHSYMLAATLNNTLDNVVGNKGRQININFRNRFSPVKGLDVLLGLAYSGQRDFNDGISLDMLSTSPFGISPYYQLMNNQGDAAAIVREFSYAYAKSAEQNGLKDWLYRPLEDIGLSHSKRFSRDMRFNTEIIATPLDGLKISLLYQYANGASGSSIHHFRDSYHVRNLVNLFKQSDGALIVPDQGILETGVVQDRYSHFGRLQLGYVKDIADLHEINLIGGMELRHGQIEVSPGSILYNYDDEYLTGTNQMDFLKIYPTSLGSDSRIPGGRNTHSLLTNRDLSYFANVGYRYRKRYGWSGSLRWDASNLFGVKANQKGIPLWSIGASWEISDEELYPFANIVPYLRVRGTYGVSGNVNKTLTHYPVISYGTSPIGLRSGLISSVGNPSLKWENVATYNLGLDWKVRNDRISGSFESYIKKGSDLLGNTLLDPTTGISNHTVNYADIESRGVDVQITSLNLKGRVSWETVWMASWVKNEVTDYYEDQASSVSSYFTSPQPMKGVSRDMVFVLPWYGLSPVDGYPILPSGEYGERDFNTYYRSLKRENLIEVGVAVPAVYGSIRNNIKWKGLEIGALLVWKADYVFKRSSMFVGGEYYGMYHVDYHKRWQKSGDEMHTDVPAFMPMSSMTPQGSAVNIIYKNNEVLVSRGDHIRIQDLVLNYSLPQWLINKLMIKSMVVSAQIRNLGVLWRANKHQIDPDYVDAMFKEPTSYTMGIKVNF